MEPSKEDLYRFPFSKPMDFREYIVKSGILDQVSIVTKIIQKRRVDPGFDPLKCFVEYFGGDPKTFILNRENERLKKEKRRLLDVISNLTDDKTKKLIWKSKYIKRFTKLETLIVEKISSDEVVVILIEFLKKHKKEESFRTLILEGFESDLSDSQTILDLYSSINEIESLEVLSTNFSLEIETELVPKVANIKLFKYLHRCDSKEISPDIISKLSSVPNLEIVCENDNQESKAPSFQIEDPLENLVGFEGVNLSSFPKLKTCSKNIEKIVFRTCSFPKIGPNAFNSFKSLKSLTFDSCIFKNNKLPSFSKLQGGLEYLELSGLSDSSLFKKIDLSSCLKTLKLLSFKNSQVISLGQANIFKGITSSLPLEILIVSNCGLKKLEKEISNLVSLRVLDLSENAQLTKLPVKQINEMTELKEILFAGNDEKLLQEVDERVRIVV